MGLTDLMWQASFYRIYSWPMFDARPQALDMKQTQPLLLFRQEQDASGPDTDTDTVTRCNQPFSFSA